MAPPQVAVCIPWTPGDPWRERSHDWTVAYWQRLGYRVFHGTDHTGGRWPNRAAMRNDAARQALDAGCTVLAFCDADTFVPREQFAAGTETAAVEHRLVMPFERYHRFTDTATQDLMAERVPLDDLLELSTFRGEMIGWSDRHDAGVIIVSARLWATVGGYDERFIRWGDEDRIFRVVCDTLSGPALRVPGPAIHLWHPRSPDVDLKARTPERQAQIALSVRYRTAAAWHSPVPAEQVPLTPGQAPDPAAVRAILAEPGGPLATPVAA